MKYSEYPSGVRKSTRFAIDPLFVVSRIKHQIERNKRLRFLSHVLLDCKITDDGVVAMFSFAPFLLGKDGDPTINLYFPKEFDFSIPIFTSKMFAEIQFVINILIVERKKRWKNKAQKNKFMWVGDLVRYGERDDFHVIAYENEVKRMKEKMLGLYMEARKLESTFFHIPAIYLGSAPLPLPFGFQCESSSSTTWASSPASAQVSDFSALFCGESISSTEIDTQDDHDKPCQTSEDDVEVDTDSHGKRKMTHSCGEEQEVAPQKKLKRALIAIDALKENQEAMIHKFVHIGGEREEELESELEEAKREIALLKERVSLKERELQNSIETLRKQKDRFTEFSNTFMKQL